SLFTGRRNTAKPAWRAILKELGLQGKVSTYQMAKKWDNLKRRYKDLKYPPVGMENVADSTSSWPWFSLMNEAMEGRLTASAPLLAPVTQEEEQHPSPAPIHRSRPAPPPPTSSSSDYGHEAFGGEQVQRGGSDCEGPLGGLEREWAALERERAALQAERLWLESERAALEQDRATLGRDREVLDQRFLSGTDPLVHVENRSALLRGPDGPCYGSAASQETHHKPLADLLMVQLLPLRPGSPVDQHGG
uniref:Uncharacterized protein n=1 Tax=Cyclopterus lumpus TaxID=8103 RepID=A0A8C2X0R3_CYCLU